MRCRSARLGFPLSQDRILATLALVVTSACVVDPGGEARGARFAVGACGPQPSLLVTLHEAAGARALERVDDAAPPRVQFGPQGGQHLLLTVAIENPSRERSGARIEFSAEWCNATCGTPGSAGRASVEALPGYPTWREDNGQVWLGGYFLVLSAPPRDARLQLHVDLLDACGRTARFEWAGRPEGL